MIKIAITGSIGMGKSTVSRMFEAAGIPVFDADREVRRMQAPGGSLVPAIAERFPAAVRNGEIDREALAQIVLANPSDLQALEAIVHPAVEQARTAFIAGHASLSALAFDIPLLFETGSDQFYDTIVVVSAPVAVQRRRVLERPGMTAAKLDSILTRQWTDQAKRDKADFVIENGGDLEATERQVRAIIACLGIGADS